MAGGFPRRSRELLPPRHLGGRVFTQSVQAAEAWILAGASEFPDALFDPLNGEWRNGSVGLERSLRVDISAA